MATDNIALDKLLVVLRQVASSHISNTLLRYKLQGCYGRHSNGISSLCACRQFVQSVPNPVFQYKRNQCSSKIYDPVDGVSSVNELHLAHIQTYRNRTAHSFNAKTSIFVEIRSAS